MSIKNKPVLVLHRKSANRPEIKAAVKAVRRSGIDLQVRIPWNKKDKVVLVKELLKRGCSRVIAGGGDGTINGVASALVKSKRSNSNVAMGILPLGTANDLAHGLGLPCDDLTECLRIASTRDARPMDVGLMNGNVFCNVASGGFGAEVTATTPQDIKAMLGGAAYTLNGLVKLWQMQPYRGTLRLPDQAPIEGAMLLMAVGNNRLAGGGFEVAPLAVPDDGKLDLMVMLEASVQDSARVLAELKDPMNPENVVIRYVQAERFSIEADHPLHINLDGEPVLVQNLEFSTLPGALGVVY
ncbi:MAG: lipid kinase YegS [Halioglobus sp.]